MVNNELWSGSIIVEKFVIFKIKPQFLSYNRFQICKFVLAKVRLCHRLYYSARIDYYKFNSFRRTYNYFVNR